MALKLRPRRHKKEQWLRMLSFHPFQRLLGPRGELGGWTEDRRLVQGHQSSQDRECRCFPRERGRVEGLKRRRPSDLHSRELSDFSVYSCLEGQKQLQLSQGQLQLPGERERGGGLCWGREGRVKCVMGGGQPGSEQIAHQRLPWALSITEPTFQAPCSPPAPT